MNIRENKGMALFIALTLMFLLAIGVIVVLLTAFDYANITENQIRRAQAFAIAESGINYAYWKIRIDQDDGGASPIVYPCTLTPPIAMPQGFTVQVNVEEVTGPSLTPRKRIRSTVTY